MKWNISKNDFEIGLKRLKSVTYPQKKYCPLSMIEQNNPLFPLSRFKFYGVVSDRHFIISPVLFGYHRNVTILYGTIEKADTKFELTIKIKFQLLNRIIWALYMGLSLLFLSLFLTATEKNAGDYCAILSIFFLIIMGFFVKVIIQWTVNENAQESLEFLQDIFNPSSM